MYVNNDPVNYVDLWGLLASDIKAYKVPIAGGGGRAVHHHPQPRRSGEVVDFMLGTLLLELV